MIPTLNAKELAVLLDLIECIHSAITIDDLANGIMQQISTLIPFRVANLTHVESEGKLDIRNSFMSDDMSKEFTEYYGYVHPTILSDHFYTTFNKPQLITEHISLSKLRHTEYYTDYQKKNSILYEMGSYLGHSDTPMGCVNLMREKSDSDFSDKEKWLYAQLLPHISIALYRLLKPSISIDICGEPNVANRVANIVHMQENYVQRDLEIHRIFGKAGLTSRQQQIVREVMQGKSNAAIAQTLCITEQTVKDHLYTIYKKVGVKNRTELTSSILSGTYWYTTELR